MEGDVVGVGGDDFEEGEELGGVITDGLADEEGAVVAGGEGAGEHLGKCSVGREEERWAIVRRGRM